ncbi:hypothetical protein MLD38_024554 [Melastoma candidum]|uniref:Uncharacterized protein n=1 Tax=Melastoma candidum TaxID=119954 RepID=A0ACB9NU77_9MYRT|nr:hypothetical protein MLD38_024554 [Melastoma candidum]
MTPPNTSGDQVRILAVDDDETTLWMLQETLGDLHYEVTTCRNHPEAISLLLEGRQGFSVVIANIDWNIGFELVELVGRNMGLPMIVTCWVPDIELVEKAIVNGALLGLLKEYLMSNPWLIWQLVIGQRGRNAVINKELASGEVEDQSSRSERCSRKESDSINLQTTTQLVWTDELIGLFNEVVDSLGENEATPKKILELMNVPFLTRGNISSRLQKHREKHNKAKEASKGEDPTASVAKSSKKNGGRAVIKEPVSINSKDNAAQLHFRGTDSSTGRAVGQIMSSCPYAQNNLLVNTITSNTCSHHQVAMNGRILPPSRVLDHRLSNKRPRRGFGEPSGHIHHGVERLGSEWIFGASQETRQSSQGNQDMQSSTIDGLVRVGHLDIDHTSSTTTGEGTAIFRRASQTMGFGNNYSRVRQGPSRNLSRTCEKANDPSP